MIARIRCLRGIIFRPPGILIIRERRGFPGFFFFFFHFSFFFWWREGISKGDWLLSSWSNFRCLRRWISCGWRDCRARTIVLDMDTISSLIRKTRGFLLFLLFSLSLIQFLIVDTLILWMFCFWPHFLMKQEVIDFSEFTTKDAIFYSRPF